MVRVVSPNNGYEPDVETSGVDIMCWLKMEISFKTCQTLTGVLSYVASLDVFSGLCRRAQTVIDLTSLSLSYQLCYTCQGGAIYTFITNAWSLVTVNNSRHTVALPTMNLSRGSVSRNKCKHLCGCLGSDV